MTKKKDSERGRWGGQKQRETQRNDRNGVDINELILTQRSIFISDYILIYSSLQMTQYELQIVFDIYTNQALSFFCQIVYFFAVRGVDVKTVNENLT